MNELQKQTLLAEIANFSDFDISLLTDEMMGNYFNTVVKINKAQKSIDWFNKFVSKLDGYGLYDMHDLKLYDLSYYIWDNKDKYGKYDNDLFSQFCEDSYFNYDAWLQEEFGDYSYNKHHDFVEQIGRTSKFIFKDFDVIEYLNKFIDYNINSGLYDYDVLTLDDNTAFNSNGISTDYDLRLITPIDLYLGLTDSVMDRYGNDESDVIENFNEYLKEVNSDLDYLIDNLLIDYKNEIANTLKVYNHIRLFKENQVENFKCWFDDNIDWIDDFKKD